jgi:hypothetical protein
MSAEGGEGGSGSGAATEQERGAGRNTRPAGDAGGSSRNGGKNKGRKYEQLVELEETAEITFPSAQTVRKPSPPPPGSAPALWEQWDM